MGARRTVMVVAYKMGLPLAHLRRPAIKVITANPTGFSIAGTTLLPGPSGIQLSSTPVPLDPSGLLDVGTSTFGLRPALITADAMQSSTHEQRIVSPSATSSAVSINLTSTRMLTLATNTVLPASRAVVDPLGLVQSFYLDLDHLVAHRQHRQPVHELLTEGNRVRVRQAFFVSFCCWELWHCRYEGYCHRLSLYIAKKSKKQSN